AIECNWLQCRYTGRGAVVLQELAGLGAKIGVWVTEAGLDSLFSRRADLLERIESCGAVEEVAQLADEEFCTLSRAEFAECFDKRLRSAEVASLLFGQGNEQWHVVFRTPNAQSLDRIFFGFLNERPQHGTNAGAQILSWLGIYQLLHRFILDGEIR